MSFYQCLPVVRGSKSCRLRAGRIGCQSGQNDITHTEELRTYTQARVK